MICRPFGSMHEKSVSDGGSTSICPPVRFYSRPETEGAETFAPDNQTIARAAAIWRSLAETQDALAEEGFAFLRAALG